jgi:serine/threonine-protein kinase
MIGETIGSYRIVSKLGEGGMGVVYRAEHPLLQRKAAVKLLHPEMSNNPEFVQRFFNEARSATLIEHPGIVDVFDFGHHASGCAFILMEFLEGESLAGRLAAHRRQSASWVISIGKQIASACSAAHDSAIVHRDLKPDNIFLVPDRDQGHGIRVKVLDFGIAKLATEAGLKTRTGVVMGTPAYMSPEQCRSAGHVDHRADIYSLGCILYEMLCGRSPFASEGSSLAQIISAHMFEEPTPPRTIEPSVPVELEAVILRAIAKQPEDRQASMQQLSTELARCAASATDEVSASASNQLPRAFAGPMTGDSGRPARAGIATTLQHSAAELEIPDPRASPRRPRLGWVLGGVLVCAGAGFTIVAVARGAGDATPVPVSPSGSSAATPVVPAAGTRTPEDAAVAASDALPSREVTLVVDSEPRGAEVYRIVDGMKVGNTPFELKVPRTSGTAVYLLKLAGYRDERIELATDRDLEQKVNLLAVGQERPRQLDHRRPPAHPSKQPEAQPAPQPELSTTGVLRPKFKPPVETK